MAGPLNPAAWNRFGYAYGNPVNLRDPSGHCPACLPLLFIAGGTLLGELAYAGHLYYTGQQANAVDLATWMVWGGFFGATVYMAPAIVGSGMSAAGMDAIGTAVWLNRIGISAYGVMQAGQWSYAWGTVLEYGGWAVVGIALLPQYRGMSEAQAAEMSAIADEAGVRMRIVGRLGETRLGQARRYVAAQLYGVSEEDKFIEAPRFGIPGWRNTGVSTFKPEVDTWIRGGRGARFPPEIEARIMRLFNATELDYYNDYPGFGRQAPAGWLFKPRGGGVSHTFFPWQEP